jgi:hypothetical protein
MNEPALQSAPQAGESLWEKAPGWRNLTMAAFVLTALAAATPALLPADVPAAPHHPHVAAAAPAAPHIQAPQAAVPSAPQLLPPVHRHPHVQMAALPPAAAPVAAPLVAPVAAPVAQPSQSCSIDMPAAPHPMSGTVVGFIAHDQSLRIFRNTQRFSGGTVNAAYVDEARVMVQPDPGTWGGSHNPVVPPGMTVAIGDHVTYQTPYRDPTQPCGFIPSQVTADQGPSASTTARETSPP